MVAYRKFDTSDSSSDGKTLTCGDSYTFKWFTKESSSDLNAVNDEGQILVQIGVSPGCEVTVSDVKIDVTGAMKKYLGFATVLAASNYFLF